MGTTSSELDGDSLTGLSSAIQGNVRVDTVVRENPILVFILLLGGRVSVLRMENMIRSEGDPSVWFIETDGLS